MGYVIVNRKGALLSTRIYKTYNGVVKATAKLAELNYGNVFYKRLP